MLQELFGCPGPRALRLLLFIFAVSTALVLAPARSDGAQAQTIYFTGRDLSYASFAGATLSGANLSAANLTFSDLMRANLSNAQLSASNGRGALLSFANLRGADLTNANLSYADLSGANLANATLLGVIWSSTICPDRTNGDDDGGTCVTNLSPARIGPGP